MQYRVKQLKVSGLLIMMGICLSCTPSNSAAPVSSLKALHPVTWGQHTVAPNETLSSIAFLYARDVRDLAQVNALSPPYPLKVGQSLSLASAAPVVPRVMQRHLPTRARVPAEQAVKPRWGSDHTLKSPPARAATTMAWQWPVQGQLLNSKSSKGIQILGQLGTPVVATAQGKVVYSGSGLRGYGRLLIIKHNEHYLSAYAHNQALLVSEGETVQGGQAIAKMGNSDAEQVKLHFEIRYLGKPVNPLEYLPMPMPQMAAGLN
jgi:lipoprotein NlpD